MSAIKTGSAIVPSDASAWEYMIYRDQALEEFTLAFSSIPTGYVAVSGAIQSGKSTLISQVRSTMEIKAEPIVLAEFDLRLATKDSDLFAKLYEKVVRDLECFFFANSEKFPDWQEFPFFTDNSEQAWQIRERNEPHAFRKMTSESFEDKLVQILLELPGHVGLALVLENVDLSTSGQISELLTLLQVMSERRKSRPRNKLSVVVTSVEKLTVDRGRVDSPFCVQHEVFLSDPPKERVRLFTQSLAKANGWILRDEQFEVLYSFTGGVLCNVQELMQYFEEKDVSEKGPREILSEDVYRAVSQFLNTQSKFSLFAFSAGELGNRGRLILEELISEQPVIANENSSDFRDLRRRGIIVNARGLCEFRSHLIKLLTIARYIKVEVDSDQLTLLEKLLIQMPMFQSVALDDSLRHEIQNLVLEDVSTERGAPARETKKPIATKAIIDRIGLNLDFEFLFVQLTEIWRDSFGKLPEIEEVELAVRSLLLKTFLFKFTVLVSKS